MKISRKRALALWTMSIPLLLILLLVVKRFVMTEPPSNMEYYDMEEEAAQEAVYLEMVIELDRALESCGKRLAHCRGEQKDSSNNASMNLQDLSAEELELLMEMEVPQMRASLEACEDALSQCVSGKKPEPDSLSSRPGDIQ